MTLQTGLEHLQGSGRLASVVGARLRRGEQVETACVAATPDTQYRIGSITKTLTAVLVLQARDDGLLVLDDALGRFVPESGYADRTLAQLLSHTGGLQSEPVGPWWERNPGVDVATLVAANDGSAAVAAAPSWFHYSNLGFALLGEAVARARDASWWELVQTRLLDPLALTRTTYDAAAPHAQGHSVVHLTGELADEPHHDTGAMAPSGQAWSTVGDLVTWARFLTDGHPRVLARDTLLEMGAATLAPSYGLGLRRIQVGGRTLVGHTGSMPGFLASLFVDQRTGDGAVLLTDATTGIAPDEVPTLLLDDAASGSGSRADPWVPTTQVPPEVAGLLGTWFWGNTAVELRWHNETLQLRHLATGRLSDVFALDAGRRIVGVEGYHRGETLHVHDDRLECATFVYTRSPRV